MNTVLAAPVVLRVSTRVAGEARADAHRLRWRELRARRRPRRDLRWLAGSAAERKQPPEGSNQHVGFGCLVYIRKIWRLERRESKLEREGRPSLRPAAAVVPGVCDRRYDRLSAESGSERRKGEATIRRRGHRGAAFSRMSGSRARRRRQSGRRSSSTAHGSRRPARHSTKP